MLVRQSPLPRMLQAALNAVNETDVLTTDIDYVAKGRELRQRQQQEQLQERQQDAGVLSNGTGSDSAGVESAAASLTSSAGPAVANEVSAAETGENGHRSLPVSSLPMCSFAERCNSVFCARAATVFSE